MDVTLRQPPCVSFVVDVALLPALYIVRHPAFKAFKDGSPSFFGFVLLVKSPQPCYPHVMLLLSRNPSTSYEL